MTVKHPLVAVLALYLLLAAAYAWATPPFEAGDELWHYPLVRHLADGNPLPVQVFDPALAGPWKQQASQPPLYYYLGAALTFWIDTSDWQTVRRLNPHVAPGLITMDGNRNLAVHDPAWNRWQGALLAVQVARLLSIACGFVTVLFTYRIGRLLHPARPELALGAAALVAFLPMFLFVSAAVNNDNLIIALATVTVWLLIRSGQAGRRPSWPVKLAVGALIGAAALSKISGVGLLPLAVGAFLIANWSAERAPLDGRRALVLLGRAAWDSLPMLATAAAVAGWWYARNVRLYGDWKGWSAFIAVLGQRNQPATLAQLWDERHGFLMSYWGLFGGVNIPMANWIYSALNWLLLVGLVGGALYALQLGRAFGRARRAPGERSVWRPAAALLDVTAAHLGLVICLLWTAAVVLGIVQWATVTWSSQGRLVFTALSAQMALLATGLLAWLPPRLSRPATAVLAGGLFAIAAVQPWLTIRPAYRPPLDQQVRGVDLGASAEFGETLRLRAAALDAPNLTPGGSLDLYLTWELTRPTARDWSIFVHLVDPVLETPVAQRDMYLGQGLLATSFAPVGRPLVNRYHIALPSTLPAAAVELTVGVYDYATGERLPLPDGADRLLLADLTIAAQPGAWPNPTDVNFGDLVRLVGYQLETPRIQRGDGYVLTLYLEPLGRPTAAYSVTAQVLAPDRRDTTRRAAADLPLPDALWSAETAQAVALQLPADPAAPAGVYDLVVGVYSQQDGRFTNLPLVTADGRITNETLLTLVKVRIDE